MLIIQAFEVRLNAPLQGKLFGGSLTAGTTQAFLRIFNPSAFLINVILKKISQMNYLVQVQDEQSSWNVVDVTDSLDDAEKKVSEMKGVTIARFVLWRTPGADQSGQGHRRSADSDRQGLRSVTWLFRAVKYSVFC